MPTTHVEPVAVFRALGHRARLKMVEHVARGEHCVADLVALVGLSWSTVSRHLAILQAAGVLCSEKRGNQVFYRLALPCVASFTQCVQAAAEGRRVEVRACCS